MADGPKIQASVSLNTEGVESKLDRVATAGETMAARLEKGADKAGKAVDGIGSGAAASVEQFTRAESRMNDSIQRQITSLQLLGKTASQKLEFRIDEEGLDPAKFEPMLVKLREAEKQAAASSVAVSSSLNKMGMSAAATANAMRGVPAQMTDIIVSLQSGQAPLTVLVQQGGQLKDMFGGVGNAARAMGSYLVGLANPLTLTAAAAGALGYAYYTGSREAEAFATSLIATGNAAGTTAGQLMDMARNVSSATGATRGAVAETLNEIAASGKVSADVLAQVSKAAIDMERAGGQAASSTVKEFVSLGDAPVSAILKLNEKYHFLTAAVYEQIKALQDQGRESDAAKLAMLTLADATEARAAAMAKNVGYVETAWRAVKDAVLGVGSAIAGIGRDAGLEEQLAKAKKYAEYLARSGDSNTVEGARSNAQAQQAIAAIEAQIKKQSDLTAAEAETNRAREAGLKWAVSSAKYLDNEAKKKAEILRVTNEMTAAGVSQAEQARVLAKIEESYATKKSASIKALKEDYSELFGRQEQMAAITKALNAELADINKTNEDYAKNVAAMIGPIEKEADSLERQLETYGQTRAQIEATTIARLEEAKALATLNGAGDEAIAFYEREIAARKRIKEASEGIDARKASKEWAKESKKSAEKAADEWQKTSDKIGDSITDALMRGFESGKSFAVTLRDTTVNMFKTMVLQPTIKAVVVGGLSAVGMGSASASDGSGGYGNYLSSGSSAYNLYKGGSGLYSSFATSSVGQSLGLSAVGQSTSVIASESMGLTIPGMATEMTSLGSTIGAAIPYVGWAIAAIAVISSMMGKGGGPKTEGDAYSTLTGNSLAMSATDRTGDNWITGSNSNAVVESLLQPIGTSVAGLIKSMGGSANGLSFNLGFSTDPEGTADDNIQSGVMDASGNYVYRNGRNAERGTYSTELQLESQRMMVAAVKAADVSWVYKDIAGSIDLYSASAEQLQTVLTQLAQVTALRTAFDTLGFGADKLSKSLIDASGGASTLSTNLESYYSNYYSESERNAKTLSQISASMADLGLTMPTTREGFRALVEAQDLTTDSGQKTFAALMGLNSAFASVVPASTAASTAISETMKSLQATTAKLQVELLSAQGKAAEATAAQRAIDTSGMTAAEAAVYDYNAALRAQIDALNAAKEAEAARSSERASLEKDLLSAQGNTVALRELERQALDASNRALFDQIRALEDQQAAAESAASAANEAFAAAQTATSAALSAVQKSVDAERKAYEASVAAERTRLNASRDVAQEAVSTVKSVLGALNSNITDLYASVDSASAQSAASGNAFIDSALAAAKKSGYLPDAAALSSAISAARGGLNANDYASQFERERATLVLAGKLSQLKDAGSSQLSVAEQSLAAANAQLEALDAAAKFAEAQFDATVSAAQAQVDALNGIDTSVLSVKDAIAALSAAILAQQAAQAKTPSGLASGLYAGNSAAITNPSASDLAYWKAMIERSGYDATKTQFDSDVTRINSQQAQIRSWYAGTPDAIKNPSASDITYWMKKIDAEGAEAAKAEFLADVKRLVPHLATGTNYVPRDMLAFVHEGEEIKPKPYNPALSGNGARDTQRLERLVESLTAEVQRLHGVVAAGNQHARRTADAVNGNPEQPMLVETV